MRIFSKSTPLAITVVIFWISVLVGFSACDSGSKSEKEDGDYDTISKMITKRQSRKSSGHLRRGTSETVTITVKGPQVIFEDGKIVVDGSQNWEKVIFQLEKYNKEGKVFDIRQSDPNDLISSHLYQKLVTHIRGFAE